MADILLTSNSRMRPTANHRSRRAPPRFSPASERRLSPSPRLLPTHSLTDRQKSPAVLFAPRVYKPGACPLHAKDHLGSHVLVCSLVLARLAGHSYLPYHLLHRCTWHDC